MLSSSGQWDDIIGIDWPAVKDGQSSLSTEQTDAGSSLWRSAFGAAVMFCFSCCGLLVDLPRREAAARLANV